MLRKQHLTSAFKDAFSGLFYFFSGERNGRIQTCIAILIILLSLFLHISAMEWIVVLLCIGIVLSMEMFNSAVEKLCDIIHKDYHPAIKIVKDVSAAAVLWVSIISAVIGIIIFLPKIISLL